MSFFFANFGKCCFFAECYAPNTPASELTIVPPLESQLFADLVKPSELAVCDESTDDNDSDVSTADGFPSSVPASTVVSFDDSNGLDQYVFVRPSSAGDCIGNGSKHMVKDASHGITSEFTSAPASEQLLRQWRGGQVMDLHRAMSMGHSSSLSSLLGPSAASKIQRVADNYMSWAEKLAASGQHEWVQEIIAKDLDYAFRFEDGYAHVVVKTQYQNADVTAGVAGLLEMDLRKGYMPTTVATKKLGGAGDALESWWYASRRHR
jgi:hypothetical protein